uniref:sugar transferase n=1 Tax=Deinococcus sp. TaxID=47478 RepID=UPI0025E396F7
ISLERTGLSLRRDGRDLLALRTRLHALQPDLVLAYTIKPVVYGLIAARAAGVKRRYALVTGLGYSFQGAGMRRRLLSALTAGLYRTALHGARRVIFQNPDDWALFVERKLVTVAQTALVNGSGVDLNQFAPVPLPEAPVFLLIARLLRDKGISEYVEAARQVRARHPQARFQLVGPLDPSPDSYTQADLDAWQAEGVIEYLGELRDVRPALAECRIYVLPSYREGTPRTVLEAMALGRPVITTDAPGCRETVTEGVNGFLVPVGDAGALADRMDALIGDPALAARMGAAGLALARQKYDVELVNRSMLVALELLAPEPRVSLSRPGDLLKRVLDVALSGFGLLVLGLPLLLLAALVRWRLGSPVLFRQARPGLHGRPFVMFKFRSMTGERGPGGELLPDAERLTRFGRFLRASSLDELPGLWNVLRGEMSLVGPRPLLTRYLPLYTAQQARRHEVRPGITGWAQVNGRNAITWERKFEYDVEYVDRRSLAFDLHILWLTLQKVICRDGISAQGEATMPLFEGSDTP